MPFAPRARGRCVAALQRPAAAPHTTRRQRRPTPAAARSCTGSSRRRCRPCRASRSPTRRASVLVRRADAREAHLPLLRLHPLPRRLPADDGHDRRTPLRREPAAVRRRVQVVFVTVDPQPRHAARAATLAQALQPARSSASPARSADPRGRPRHGHPARRHRRRRTARTTPSTTAPSCSPTAPTAAPTSSTRRASAPRDYAHDMPLLLAF